MKLRTMTMLYLAVALLATAAVARAAETAQKIPITTTSAEARELYLQGRDAGERLLATDAKELFEKALAKDPNFAMAHYQLALATTTTQGFFDEMKKAVALADKVSPGERHLILATDAAARGDVATQKENLTALVAAYPGDERAQTALGLLYFGRQDYAKAIDHLDKAIAINPSFSAPYNQLGYAQRYVGDDAAAEKAFKKYIELIPKDPNPYDSYAEFLMAAGRYEESIASYEKALAIDPNFASSYVGIANNQMFMGHGDKARATLAKAEAAARNLGERRQALFWTASSYVGDGDTDRALATVQKMFDLAGEQKDPGNQAGDLMLMGQILLDAGKTDEAAAKFAAAVKTTDGTDMPAGAKETTRRNDLYFAARVALKKGDLAAAKAKAGAYRTQAEAKGIPFELRRVHELAGRLALHEKTYDRAVVELTAANQQDPTVVWALAKAYEGAGDKAKAKATFAQATRFNVLSFNYGFVRSQAKMKKAEPAR